jgi:hypothetical protein
VKAETADPGTLGSLLPKRRRRLLLGMFMLTVAAFFFTSAGQFRSVDDVNIYSTTHSLTSLRPNVDICQGTNQSADFLYTRGPFGCVDPNTAQLAGEYQTGAHGKTVSRYGIGEPLAAAPFFGSGRIVADILEDGSAGRCTGPTAIACCKTLVSNPGGFRANCQGDTRDMIVQTMTFGTNALLTALTLVLIVIVSLQLGAPLRGAVLIGFAYGFGSFAFAYTKSLSTEPGTAMCLIAAVMLAIEAKRTGRTRTLVACGVVAGAALFFRITAAVFLPVLGVWFLVIASRKFDIKTAIRWGVLFSGGVIASGAVLSALNYWRYGDALSIGYGQTGSNLHGIRARGNILTGVWGLWLSPGKSVFVYAPFAILAVAGIVIAIRRLPAEISLLIALIGANTLLFARVRFWSGDWAWGPRYMIIVLPCVAVMCGPLVGRIRWRRALAILAGVGFVLPGAVGSMINFNLFYQRARVTLGVNFRNSVYHDWSWNPIWRQLGLLGNAWGNLGKPYGILYMTGQPRIDFWWLDDRWWLSQHVGRLIAAILMLFAIAALAAGGAYIIQRTLRPRRAAATAPAKTAPIPA